MKKLFQKIRNTLAVATTIFLLSSMKIDLYSDDCFNILPKISDNSVDLILCDLPYGTTDCKWDIILPMEKLWQEYSRVAKEGAAIILTASQPFTTYLINSNPKKFRYELIWYKTKASGFLNARKMPNKSHENILVFYDRLPVYNPVKYSIDKKFAKKGKILGNGTQSKTFNIRGEKSKNYQYIDDGSRYPDSVLCFPSEWEPNMHPTQKPVALFNFLIRLYSNPGDTVLDNCMGHGTTGVAAVQLGRSFIGIEKDLDYFERAKERIETAEAQQSNGLFSDF